TTLMICSAVLLFGTISLFNVPLDLLPDINFPVITIDTRISGYSPPEVENWITKPIEAMISTMNNVHKVRSTSSEGLSTVRIEFDLGTNMDYASAEAREKINLIRDTFPKDARNPQIRKYNPSEAPVMIVSVHGDLSAVRLKGLVEENIEKRLKRVEGVGNVEVKGGKEREIVVEIDHGRLKATGLSISGIADTLESNNLNFQVGSLAKGDYRLITRTVGEYKDLAQIENIGLKRTSRGSMVYLKDIARVSDSFGKEMSLIRFQGQPRVMLYIQKESGANAISISEKLKKELLGLQSLFENKLKIDVIYDQASFISGSINRLRNEAILGAGLAMIVLLLFLRNFQSILVVGMAIPISIIATFTFMYVFGITLNIISLSGFTLGVGMLVDNAIVVIENIFRKRQVHYEKTKASLIGTGEVIKAITISTFAHIAVFLPVIFLQKEIRMLYSGLFFTVSFSLLASLLVALTIIPLLSSKLNLMPVWKGKKKGNYYRLYRKILLLSLRNRGKVIFGGLALFFGSLFLLPSIGFEPMARIDRGEFTVVIRTPPGTTLLVTDKAAREVEQILVKKPEVKDVSVEVKGEIARVRVRLIPEHSRIKTTREVVEELRPKINSIPRAQIHFNIGRATSTGNKIVLEVNGYDQQTLASLAFKVKEGLLGIQGISDVVIHQSNPKPEMQIRVLHDKAGAYGLSAIQIAKAVRSRITGPIATEYVDKGKEVDLRVRLRHEDIKDLSMLKDISIPVKLSSGQQVLLPIGEVSTFHFLKGMAEIHRKDQHRMISISAEIGKEDLARTAAKVEKEMSNIQFPEEYSYNFGENYQKMKESQKEMIFAFALAVILVYMILASLFESFLYPLTIMFSVPMAIIGCLIILYVSGRSINIPVYVGAITLAGIVVNNAVVLVDYIKLLKSKGMGRWRAIIRGGESRLRPILMTSGTTLLALLPMALDKGEGSNLWSPLALTVIGGLITSTILTLIILPVLCSFVKDH
ncbi:efflux RND transporter permease subunit, partial [bacterium]|nr:efflux RND transporter permease subunit [bacterium]